MDVDWSRFSWYIDNLVEKEKERRLDASSCSDFGIFDSEWGKCGTSYQGGEKCLEQCIKKQVEYCSRNGGGSKYKMLYRSN